MSDEKKQNPSADDIVNKLAQDLGVENESVPGTKDSAPDMMAGLGGIFDVAKSSKKKPKAEPPKAPAPPAPPSVPAPPVPPADVTPVDPALEPTRITASPQFDEDHQPSGGVESATSEVDTKVTEKPKKEKNEISAITALDGVFKPSSKADDIDLASIKGPEDLDDPLYDDMPIKQRNPLVPVLVGVVVLLVGVISAGAYIYTDIFDDLGRVIQGDYREYKLAEKLRIEEEHRQAQMAGLERYGRLLITGEPLYASIKINGQTQYGQTPSGVYTELRVGPSTIVQDLKLSQTYVIEVSAAGFLTETYTITEGMWQASQAGMDYQYTLTANLRPESPKLFEEYGARMEADIENEYYGAVTVVTNPPKARVIFNNQPLLDKQGNELLTPVTFDEYYVKNEDNGRLEARQVRVDTPFDRGHKLEVEMPESEDTPKYVTALQRRMWGCDWKEESAIRRLPRNSTIQHQCNYKWELNLDFDAMKRYIAEREAEREAVKERNNQLSQESGDQDEKG